MRAFVLAIALLAALAACGLAASAPQRTFDVSGLVAPTDGRDEFKQALWLVDLLTSAIAPETWARIVVHGPDAEGQPKRQLDTRNGQAKGDGVMIYHRGGLLVEHQPAVHEQIEALLGRLRALQAKRAVAARPPAPPPPPPAPVIAVMPPMRQTLTIGSTQPYVAGYQVQQGIVTPVIGRLFQGVHLDTRPAPVGCRDGMTMRLITQQSHVVGLDNFVFVTTPGTTVQVPPGPR